MIHYAVVLLLLMTNQEPSQVELTFSTTTESKAYPGAAPRASELPTVLVLHRDGGSVRRGSRECLVDLETRKIFSIDHHGRKYFRLDLPFSIVEEHEKSQFASALNLGHLVSAEVATERQSEPTSVGDWKTTPFRVMVKVANGTEWIIEMARAELPEVDFATYRRLIEHCASLRLEEEWTKKILDLGGVAVLETIERTSPGGATLKATSRLESIEVRALKTLSLQPPEGYEERSEPYVKFIQP